jgi:predicted heme/steroid binding protein
MLPFELAASTTNSFTISDGTNTDAVALGSTLTFASGSAALVPIVTNNNVTYSPTFGTLINTFAQGNDARFHNPVTIGTANGLSMSTQVLSLAAATTGSAGAMSASDKTKLDGIALGATANVGTVTSVALTVPAAFSITGSPITTAGTLAITAGGTSSQYITGAGALATLNTANVPENTNLYFTTSRARTSISLTTTGTTGAATYDNTTGVLNIPSYIGGVTSFNTRTGAIVLSSADVTTALTYTPVPTNRNLTINGVSFDLSADRSWTIASGVTSFNTRTGAITPTAGDYTTALVTEVTNLYYTDARARAAISLTTTGTSGSATYDNATGVLNIPAYQGGVTSFNTRTGAITLTSGDVTTALTYTPYNATNPAGYITGITSGNVTTALGYTPENAANKGIANGYASLDGGGLVPSTQLPSYVDDVLEYTNLAGFPATGETGKIYVALDNNKIYRWSGTTYIEVSPTVGTIWGGITGTLSNQTDLQSALNAKQNTLTLTTTGTSGAATLVGSTLNIPEYQGGVTSFNTRTGAITLSSTDVTTALGYTPVTNARTLTINGTTYDLTANRSWTVSGTLAAGGTAGQILSKIDATDYNTQWIDNYATQLKHEVKLGATITKGKAVYVSSADGTNMIVSAASNATESTSSKTLGLLETGGITNDIVKVVTEGLLAGLDTSTATIGDSVWLGVNGALLYGLANKPVAPAHLVFIGVVTRVNSNNGEIFVKVQNGFELNEIHDVLVGSYGTKDVLYRDTTTNLWKNGSIASVLGYTPYDAANPSNYIALTALSSTATGLTYTNTTGVFSLTSGYVIPTTASATNWDTAYTNRITSLTTTGSSGSATLSSNTLNIPTYTLSGLGGQPLSTNLTSLSGLTYASSSFVKMTASGTFTLDTNAYYLSSNPDSYIALTALSSTATGLTYTNTTGVFSLTSGYVIPTTTSATNWDTAYTNRITSLTTTGSSGSATLVSNVLNIPTYTLTGLGGVPSTRNITINGTTYDLSADRTWTISTNPSARNEQNFIATAAQTTFTITGGYVVGLVDVFVNGVRYLPSDYTATNGTTVVLGIGLLAGDAVTILNYTSSIAALPTSRNVQDYTATAGQTTFTVTNGYIVGLIDVFVNGSKLTSSEFTATNGTTFVLTVASTVGDQVQSINYTASVNGISGAGTINYVPKFTASGTIGNSALFQSGNNLGLGTTSPVGDGTVLNLYGSTASTLKLQTAASGTTITDGGEIVMYDSDLIIKNREAGIIQFATTGTERMRITSAGNVGIGNTGNSSRKLEVTQPTGYSAGIRIVAETGPGDAKIQFFGGGSSQMDIGPSAASPNDLIFGAGGSERMRITSAGSLLLGSTAAPTITGGTAFLIGDTIFCSGTFGVPASYGQSLRIDIVWNNWGGNNVAAIVEIDMIAREWANLSGVAFGRVYALSSGGSANFNNALNTSNMTTANGSFSLTSPASYTLRLTFTPTNSKDLMGYFIKIPNSTGGTGTNISSITASLV